MNSREVKKTEGKAGVSIATGSLGTTPLIRVSGELDHLSGTELSVVGRQELGRDGRVLLLDLTQCSYIDSGGLGALFKLLREMGPRGMLGLIGVNQDVFRILEIVGLPRMASLRSFKDIAEARAALAPDADARLRTVPPGRQ